MLFPREKNAVDKALYKANTAILVGTSTWLEQFKQAFSVKGKSNAFENEFIYGLIVSEEDDDDVVESGEGTDREDQPATCKDYILHFISFFWKFLFAFVPPTSKHTALQIRQFLINIFFMFT